MIVNIAFFIGFVVLAFRVVKSVKEESEIFLEFDQKRSIAATTLLFPFGPILLLILPSILGWLPSVIVTSLCYFPAWISSRKAISAFDRSGTSRTNKALSTSNHIFGGALLGMIYIAIYLVFTVFSIGISN